MKCIHFVKKTKDVFYFLQIYFVNILTYVYTNSSTLRTILNVLANIIFQLLSYGIVYVSTKRGRKFYFHQIYVVHMCTYIRIYVHITLRTIFLTNVIIVSTPPIRTYGIVWVRIRYGKIREVQFLPCIPVSKNDAYFIKKMN